MMNLKLPTVAALLLFSACPAVSAADLYLFYNARSPHLSEIGLDTAEAAAAYDDIYGPAAEELPQTVRMDDFYAAKVADGSYVFMLDSSFNCAQLGCATAIYARDSDGDLFWADNGFPVKCKPYDADKLLCVKGGYKAEKQRSSQPRKRKIIHYPAPVSK